MKFDKKLLPSLIVLFLFGGSAFACSGKEDSGGARDGDGDTDTGTRPDEGTTGATCEVADDCFADVEGEIAGEAICLDRVNEGYCTHECTADEDCCSAEGECPENQNQVCSPFESGDTMMCFLSCEDADIEADPDFEGDDANEFCQVRAGSDFLCRSSGGGSNNRKVCVPGDCDVGADCDEDADCSGDLKCVTGFAGGYCTETGCAADSDCPDGSVCVDDEGDENICMKSCETDTDCTFCRASGVGALCDDEVTLSDGSTGAACIPARL